MAGNIPERLFRAAQRNGKTSGKRRVATAPLILLAVCLSPAAGDPPANPAGIAGFLETDAAMNAGDIARLQSGKAVTRNLPEHEKGELAMVGAVRVAVPLGFVLARFRTMPRLERVRRALTISEFSNPPRESDLNRFRLTAGDLRDFSSCKPGNCGVKLSVRMIDEVREFPENIRTPQGRDAEMNRYRNAIFGYVSAYRKRGNSAIIEYGDKFPQVSGLNAFLGLLGEFPWLRPDEPGLYTCLAAYAGKSCPGTEQKLYWSVANVHLKPVFTVDDVLISNNAREAQPSAAIAFKQIYADHYFEAALGVAVLIGDPGSRPGLWIVYFNRSLTDDLTGWLGPIKRAVAGKKTRDAVQNDLMQLKKDLEQRYRTSLHPR